MLNTGTGRQIQNNSEFAIRQLKTGVTQVSWFMIPVVMLLLALNQVTQEQALSPLLPLLALVGIIALLLSRQEKYLDLSTDVLLLFLCAIALVMPQLDGFLLMVIISLPVAALFASTYVYGFLIFSYLLKAFIVDVFPTVLPVTVDPSALFTTVSLVVGLLSLLSVLLRLYRLYTQRLAIDASRSKHYLQASNRVGHILSQYIEEDLLLQQSVELLHKYFDTYHVALYRVLDMDQMPVPAAAFPADLRGLPENENLVERSVLADEIMFHKHRGEDIRELVLPIKFGSQILGVLQLYRQSSHRFDHIELQTLQIISLQLATALQNIHLYQNYTNTDRENKRLFMESRSSLREIDNLKRQLTREAWDEYLQTEQRTVSGVILDEQGFRPESEWSEEMELARKRRHSLIGKKAEKQTIIMPIELRNEVIGAIEVEVDADTHEDDIQDMLNSIAGRLAISLDNARLFEETQQVTIQEQQVSELVARYQAASSVEDLLKITLEGLSASLGAENARIRLAQLPDIQISSPRLEKIRETGEFNPQHAVSGEHIPAVVPENEVES